MGPEGGSGGKRGRHLWMSEGLMLLQLDPVDQLLTLRVRRRPSGPAPVGPQGRRVPLDPRAAHGLGNKNSFHSWENACLYLGNRQLTASKGIEKERLKGGVWASEMKRNGPRFPRPSLGGAAGD